MTDFVMALRALRQQPRFSAIAVLTMAVAIGACSALFSIYDRLVLNPLSLPNPSTLVAVLSTNPQLGAPNAAVSWPRFTFLRDRARAFDSIGVSAFDNFTLTGNGEPEQLNGLRTSGAFFETLGVTPARGRVFTAGEDIANGPAVCLISYELWQGRFGGRDDLLGQAIILNGQPWQVIGITPPRLTAPFGQVQVFAPRVFEVGGLTPAQVQVGAGYSQPIARLKSGVSLDQARCRIGGAQPHLPGRVPRASRCREREHTAALHHISRRRTGADVLHPARCGRRRPAHRLCQRRVAVSRPACRAPA